MSLDALSPIAPARVKALVVPIGSIRRERFSTFVDRLNSEHVVHLRDISADGRPNRNMFSPLAFPNGAIFYDLVTHAPAPSHLALAPFDLYREPLALVAIADGDEINRTAFSKRQSSGRTLAESNIRSLYQDLEDLRDSYPKALVHQVLIFDYALPPAKEDRIPIPEGIITIPPAEQHKRTTMKTVMCDISSLILAEMTTLAKSFEGMSYVDSPGQVSSIRHLSGVVEEGSSPARRNSQYAMPTNVRSSSASGIGDRSHARMSMPPVPSKGTPFASSSSSPARPSTPVGPRSALSNGPITLDDISSANGGSGPASPEQPAPPLKSDVTEGFRAQSQDRVSVQGFGPGSLNERWRTKGKSRVQIVLGSLYLQAGRWSDSIRELAEAATIAKSINDHLWHGKALELILVNLLLLGWADIQFQVPSVLLPPSTDKATTVAATLNPDADDKDTGQPRWIRNLQAIIPELLDRILGLYSRISAEHLPPLPFSEAILRSCKILTALHACDGRLGRESLDMMVLGKSPERRLTTSPRFSILPNRTQIVSTLFRAFPASAAELLTTVDRIVILSGIASVLGVLGFQRKKAFVMRELVLVLTGGLVEARTRGAADVGIHPAAGLAALNGISNMHGSSSGAGALELGEGDIEHGMDAFLGLLLKTYGVVSYDMSADSAATPEDSLASLTDDSDASALSRIRKQSVARFFGMTNVKLEILRTCIKFSNALPDFDSALRFSSDLLRTAGSGVAPGPRREDVFPAITKEEQTSMVANILKTSSLSRRLGVGPLAAEYWDEFLLRGVKLEPLAASRTPVAHAKSVIPDTVTARTSQDVNPFIYNPFLKQPDKAATDRILVAGEKATFRLTLQNPYEIEVEVESVRLDTEGAEFESAVERTIIGPYRTQILKITGTPRRAGPLQITGAIIRVKGCRERRFPIFVGPWAPEDEIKIKASGLAALEKHMAQPLSPAAHPLKPERLELTVISQQPIAVVQSSTLPQSSVMILEGERQTFSVTMRNLSTTTPVDFLLFSFQDSTQEPLQAAINSREATPVELYEYELILAKKQALRVVGKSGPDGRFIAPGQTATFDFEILGKPGLTSALIQADYAYLGVSPEQVAERFYTRQISMELTVTVNASVEVTRMDILPLYGSIPPPLSSARTGHEEEDEGEDKEEEEDEDEEEEEGGDEVTEDDDYCLLLLDLRNAWPSHMLVEIEVAKGGARVAEYILPGNTGRLVVPLRRILIDDPHAPIPSLNPSRQRQFVVSTTRISPDAERANREAFWYRERILDALKGTWSTTTSGARRSGVIELRSMRLTSRMVEAVKVEEMGIGISVEPVQAAGDSHSTGEGAATDTVAAECNTKTITTTSTTASSKRKHRHHQQQQPHVVFTDEYVQLRVRLTNRTPRPIYPMLRLMPTLCHRPLNVSLDFTRKLAWNGTLQQALPASLPPSATVDVWLGLMPLCRGAFEIAASVEETRLWAPATEAEEQEDRRGRESTRGGGHPRSEEQTWMDDAALGLELGLGGKLRERRIWHSRRACCIVVRDREQ